ncbi:MAG: hypothetical protein V3T88_08715 [Nitrosomonadaceae bacterium]
MNTIIQQGEFTSDGADKIIALRSDVDWVEVHNLTTIAASTQWDAVKWYWQREMDQDDSVLQFHATASQILSMSTSAVGFNGATYRGISLIDSSDRTPGAAVTVSAGTNATQPVYSTADTGTMIAGSIVRIQNTAHDNIDGLDFTVDTVTADTSFRLANTLQQAPGVVSGAGTYRLIAQNATVYNMFAPRKRNIANITQAAAGVVTTLVDHGYVTGEKVRMIVPAASTMIQLNGQLVTVTRLTASTFSINVDTTGYTAFTFPLPAASPYTPAHVVPVGEDPATGLLDDATLNTAFLGMILGTSGTAGVAAGSPGGTTSDVIKWRAGKSFATEIA